MTETKPFGSATPVRPGPDQAPKAEPPPLAHWKKKAILFGAGLVALALAYGAGRLQGHLALDRAAEQYQIELQGLKTAVAGCQSERDLLSARRSLSLVALALDRRNFGVAETHRRQALDLLARPSLSGVPGLAPLTEGVKQLRLDVDPDPGKKRDSVIATSEALDRLSPRDVKLGPPAAAVGGTP